MTQANKVLITKSWFATLEPHGLTERWTYTVPAGREALIMNTMLEQGSVLAPTVPGNYVTIIQITPPAPTVGDPYPATHVNALNRPEGIGTYSIQFVSPQVIAPAGSVINFEEANGCTGGEGFTCGQLTMLEYDA